MALNQLKTLVATATQGSADAFVQQSIVTGLQAIGDIGYKIRRVFFSLPAPVEVDSAVYVSVTQKSMSATPAISERSLIAAIHRAVRLTTSGIFVYDTAGARDLFRWDDDEDMVIATDPLYLQLDSDATSASNVAVVRIDYQEVRLTETQRLSIMNNALTG
jgi:hypothetical protein